MIKHDSCVYICVCGRPRVYVGDGERAMGRDLERDINKIWLRVLIWIHKSSFKSKSG